MRSPHESLNKCCKTETLGRSEALSNNAVSESEYQIAMKFTSLTLAALSCMSPWFLNSYSLLVKMNHNSCSAA